MISKKKKFAQAGELNLSKNFKDLMAMRDLDQTCVTDLGCDDVRKGRSEKVH